MRPGLPVLYRCEHCGVLWTQRGLASGSTVGSLSWTDGYVHAPSYPLESRLPLFRCGSCRAFNWFKPSLVLAPEETPTLPALGVEDFYDALAARVWNTPEQERELRTLAWWFDNHSRRTHPPPHSDDGCLVVFAGIVAVVVAFPLACIHRTAAAYLALGGALLAGVSYRWLEWTYQRYMRRRREELDREVDPLPLVSGDYPDAATPAWVSDRLRENLAALEALLDPTIPKDRLTLAEIARELGRFTACERLLGDCAWTAELAPYLERIRWLLERHDAMVRRLPDPPEPP